MQNSSMMRGRAEQRVTIHDVNGQAFADAVECIKNFNHQRDADASPIDRAVAAIDALGKTEQQLVRMCTPELREKLREAVQMALPHMRIRNYGVTYAQLRILRGNLEKIKRKHADGALQKNSSAFLAMLAAHFPAARTGTQQVLRRPSRIVTAQDMIAGRA